MGNWLYELFCKVFKKPHKSATPEPEQPLQKRQYEVNRPQIATQSRRQEDMSAEAQLAYFMDKYLYSDFPNGEAFDRIRRISDKNEQLNGVDVEFIGKDGTRYCVDEKAQLYYLNQDLPTFAFEIIFKRDGYDTTGWLCNSSLKTDLYMLIWPFATQDTSKGITWDKFTKADCLLIHKNKILKMLYDRGLSVEKMQRDAEHIRRAGQIGKIPIEGLRGIYYYASNPQRYREAPINIVISKSILKGIAQRRYIVTPENGELV